MSCGTGGERISGHNPLRDALLEVAVSAFQAPTTYLISSCLNTGLAGDMQALFVTVVNYIQTTAVAGTATNPGFAHTRNMQEAEEDCR